MPNIIVVKIIEMQKPIVAVPVPEYSTVRDVFAAAGKEFKQGEVTTRNGNTVYPDTRVTDEMYLCISKMIKGNVDGLFEVEFIRIGGGGRVVSAVATPGSTIKSVLDGFDANDRAGFFRADGTPAFEFRLSGSGVSGNEPVNINTVLPTPSTGKIRVLCSQVIKGN